ncbi:Sugar transferase involved in LPS biosynthesis (colanic, teichoic acid) [Brevibacterium sp. 239c]|uniref:sugar transferase n=1 Tax=Brevibacterium sp. 239c TaxID=1965356 RepID=UPI000C691E06|nr:sugar transferase [Brevibacterium sp. 239c]SMX82321.1 Sugar transferase involved in LPS biosynthesis (colanic, teichoic acid) [Brevibacterium sp. 239c]
MTTSALSQGAITYQAATYAAQIDTVFASRRRMFLAISVQVVITIFSTSLVFSLTHGPEAVWILLWCLLDALSGGSSSLGTLSRSVRIPLLSAVIVTGTVAFIAAFTPLNEIMSVGSVTGEDHNVFLLALWGTAGATAGVRVLIPALLPKRTLRIVTEAIGGRNPTTSDLVVSRRTKSDSDAFVSAVLAEVRRRDVELVELAFGIDAEVLRRLCWELRNRDVELYFPLFDLGLDPARVHARSATDSSGLLISPSRPVLLVRVLKRMFDVVTASALVLILSVPLLVVAIAIKISMPGPVFYTQERIGLDGRPFRIIKFRSMIVNADVQLKELLKSQGTATQPLFKVTSDPRITRLGQLLRKSSIDELPQLFNVIGGSMSLVGPRPQRDGEVALYQGSDHHRLGVRPGMTGLWQVSGRSDLGWAQAREFDLYYAHNWNLKNDLTILLRTFGAVVRAAGAQ